MIKNYNIEKVKQKGLNLFFKNQDHYILWLNVISKHGIGSIKIFEGTRHECEKFAKNKKISLKKQSKF